MTQEDFDVVDEFKAGNIKFELGKAYVIIARNKKGNIIAARPVFTYFHMTNLINKLQTNPVYRKEFLEKYNVQGKKNGRKKEYKIQHLVNWYFGNYCVKKCHDDLEIQKNHWEQLQEFARKNPNLQMTHKEFIEFFAKDMTICKFDCVERERMPSWKEVKREECILCKKFGIR